MPDIITVQRSAFSVECLPDINAILIYNPDKMTRVLFMERSSGQFGGMDFAYSISEVTTR